MIFPPYRLARYQAEFGPQADYFMGASAPESISLESLLSLADAQERDAWSTLSLGYATSQGDPELREIISANYPGLSAENIVTFAGAQEAIFVAYHALLHPRDRVQVILPIFEPLSWVAQDIGAQIDALALQPLDERRWGLDLDQWRAAVGKETALAVINFPHNPTGKLISKAELHEMVDHCASNQCWLFSDEVFRGLEYRDQDRLPPVASLYAKGLSLGVMSKTFGLGGVRLGWIACQNLDLIKRMLEIKQYLSICNGRTDELLAKIALRNAPQLLHGVNEQIRCNLELLKSEDTVCPAWLDWFEPEAGCVAFPRYIGELGVRVFAEQLLSQTGVMVVPGDCFIWDDNHFRAGFGRSDFSGALTAFAVFKQ